MPPSDAPLELGGIGPPPGRQYQPHTVSVELIAKIRVLVAGWKGKPLPLPPRDADLGQQILDRMLKDGKCQAADIMAADNDDLKAAEKICRDMEKADWAKSGKGSAGRGKYFGLGHVKLALADKKERLRERAKDQETADAEANDAARKLLAKVGVEEEWAEIDAAWAKLTGAKRNNIVRAYQQAKGSFGAWKVDVKLAKVEWWQQLKG